MSDTLDWENLRDPRSVLRDEKGLEIAYRNAMKMLSSIRETSGAEIDGVWRRHRPMVLASLVMAIGSCLHDCPPDERESWGEELIELIISLCGATSAVVVKEDGNITQFVSVNSD